MRKKISTNVFNNRVILGKLTETEDFEGNVVRSFYHIGQYWCEIRLSSLTSCLPFGVSNESSSRKAKALYKVRIRSNALLLGHMSEITRMKWKNKMLTISNALAYDPELDVVEGSFYDFGQEIKNG